MKAQICGVENYTLFVVLDNTKKAIQSGYQKN